MARGKKDAGPKVERQHARLRQRPQIFHSAGVQAPKHNGREMVQAASNEPQAEDPRCGVLRRLLAVIIKGRTLRARLLRLETFGLLLRSGNATEIAGVARRLKCSPRRVQQVQKEVWNAVFAPEES